MVINKFVLLIADNELAVASGAVLPNAFLYRGENFRSIDYGASGGGFHGHHDWLRDDSGRILGVRHWFLDYESVVTRLRALPYVVEYAPPPNAVIEIYLSELRQYRERLSEDHVIGADEIYLSSGGTVAIGYERPIGQELTTHLGHTYEIKQERDQFEVT
jgi:hypothetical protein